MKIRFEALKAFQAVRNKVVRRAQYFRECFQQRKRISHQKWEIVRLHKTGLPTVYIALKFGIPESKVVSILKEGNEN